MKKPNYTVTTLAVLFATLVVLSFSSPALAGEENIEEYISEPATPLQLEQPLGGSTSVANVGEYIQLVYNFALGIVGIIAVVLIMFGGMRWISAAGNEQTIGTAKEIIVSALIGLFLALFSYSILVFVNPEFDQLDVAVLQIPVSTEFVCGDPPPSPIAKIETKDGLVPNGHSGCDNAVVELYAVVEKMRNDSSSTATYCPGCSIVVNSGYRSSEKQAELRACYEAAVDEGIKDGSTCFDGCSSCNPANKPCSSNHEKGIAFDVVLSGVSKPGVLESSAGFARANFNNGENGANPELGENQKLLKAIMQSGDFKPISNEWWHFEYTGGSCSTGGSLACNSFTVDGVEVADNGYCSVIRSGRNTTVNYDYATCVGGKVVCPADTGLLDYKPQVPGNCGDRFSTHYQFSGSDRNSPPACVGN